MNNLNIKKTLIFNTNNNTCPVWAGLSIKVYYGSYGSANNFQNYIIKMYIDPIQVNLVYPQ